MKNVIIILNKKQPFFRKIILYMHLLKNILFDYFDIKLRFLKFDEKTNNIPIY